MEIDDLPNDLLVKIFKPIALQKRLQLRLVSRRWKKNVEAMCLRQTSLKLFSCVNAISDYTTRLLDDHADGLENWALYPAGSDKNDDLIFPPWHLNEEQVDWLAELFPNVKNLVVHLNCFLPTLPRLLANFSDTLTSLSISGHNWHNVDTQVESDEPVPNYNLIPILRAINNIPNLKRLYLPTYSGVNLAIHNFLRDVLPKLEHLDISRFQNLSDWMVKAIINRLGRNCTCLRISTYIKWSADGCLKEYLERKARLAGNLKHLLLSHADFLTTTPGQTIQGMDRFASLQYLEINPVFQLLIDSVLRSISQNTSIVTLSLSINFNFKYQYADDFFERLTTPNDRPMRTVKRLEIGWNQEDSKGANRRAYGLLADCVCRLLAHWLPEVERLQFIAEDWRCRDALSEAVEERFPNVADHWVGRYRDLGEMTRKKTMGRHAQ